MASVVPECVIGESEETAKEPCNGGEGPSAAGRGDKEEGKRKGLEAGGCQQPLIKAPNPVLLIHHPDYRFPAPSSWP